MTVISLSLYLVKVKSMKFFALAFVALFVISSVSAQIPPPVDEVAGKVGSALTVLTKTASDTLNVVIVFVLNDAQQLITAALNLQTQLTLKLKAALGSNLVSGILTSPLNSLIKVANGLLDSVVGSLNAGIPGPLAGLLAPINGLKLTIQSLLSATGATAEDVVNCVDAQLGPVLDFTNKVTADVQNLVDHLMSNFKNQTGELLAPFTAKVTNITSNLGTFQLTDIPSIVSPRWQKTRIFEESLFPFFRPCNLFQFSTNFLYSLNSNLRTLMLLLLESPT